jgi:hypothetical protein
VVHDSHLDSRYHGGMNKDGVDSAPLTRWWLMPVVVGLVAMVAALLFGDFRPVVERFYSVF